MLTPLADLFTDADYRFQMNLHRGNAAQFFAPTDNHSALIQERRHWLESEPQTYSAFLPDCDALLDECVSLSQVWGSIAAETVAGLRAIPLPEQRCVHLGTLWEPDFLLLRNADGALRLVGGCVCFPSSWALAEKIGHPLSLIHGPVPGLNAQLGRSIDSFLGKLSPDTAWLRHNWGLSASPELNQHPPRGLPRLTGCETADNVWLRVEHQALVALPRSRGVLFGIRIANYPLALVRKDRVARERLIRALRTMPADIARYKGLEQARQYLVTLIED